MATETEQPLTLPAMTAQPSLLDIYNLRLTRQVHNLAFPPANHMIQSATLAMKSGADELTILGCLLHDIGFGVMRPDHGWWGAQILEPYVPEEVVWAIRYHQALRFYPDEAAGYTYPELYLKVFGPDYRPPAYVEAAYKYARNHRWYMKSRMITLYDDYSFDKAAPVTMDPFIEIIGRHFKQPAEGLGFDDSPVAHMWRAIIDPTKPL